jgi:hypothetical protein
MFDISKEFNEFGFLRQNVTFFFEGKIIKIIQFLFIKKLQRMIESMQRKTFSLEREFCRSRSFKTGIN